MGHSSGLNKFLNAQRELSSQQQAKFWIIAAHVHVMLGPTASKNSQEEAISSSWNRHHLELIMCNSVGLIGLMTEAHMHSILGKMGQDVFATHLGIRAPYLCQPDNHGHCHIMSVHPQYCHFLWQSMAGHVGMLILSHFGLPIQPQPPKKRRAVLCPPKFKSSTFLVSLTTSWELHCKKPTHASQT